jgi:hypothetical protein
MFTQSALALSMQRSKESLYGTLTNWRPIYNKGHSDKVMRGYEKIHDFILKGYSVNSRKEVE